MKTLPFLLAALACLTTLHAQEAPDAGKLAAQLADAVWDGSSTARLKMDFQPAGGEKTVLQLKINARRTREGTDVHYQVLWPKDRKDGSFVLRQPAGQPATGSVLGDGAVKPIRNLQDGIFGSDLAYEDLTGNYFAWPTQKIVGSETLKNIPCQILESRPGAGDSSGYGSVKTWIDPKRVVPLKVEKFDAGGQLVRRITMTLITRDDRNRTVPANFTVERPGKSSRTILEGSNIKHDVQLTDADFSPKLLEAAP
jgi:hypothetical protein